ncbi:MAG: alkaline phosphatase [Ignavibacteriaceae bacterium]|nr:alkaline phosphatase [Ignavibacteriaceae bacterium]
MLRLENCMRPLTATITFLIVIFITVNILWHYTTGAQNIPTGNVIFIHPDGTSLATWNATRLLYYGTDGMLNWDRLTHIGLYQGHTKNTLTASSQAGATIHAYGVKVDYDSYGMDGTKPLTSLSGYNNSIMIEARESGINIGIINSGTIVEPGSGAFVSSDVSRANGEDIAKKIIESSADLILSGGEQLLIPEGVEGIHGPGKRKDGLDLIEGAKQNGYYVVYNKEELLNLPADAEKVLGVFAFHHTFNDKSEEQLKSLGLPNYKTTAPTLAEMTDAAINFLSKKGGNFFLVIEEEGTDNFGNSNNANGIFEALKRADDAIGISYNFLLQNPNTLLITTADSEAGGLELRGFTVESMNPDLPLPLTDNNGAPLDGRNGQGTLPFISAPDKLGNTFPFSVVWSSYGDVCGSVIAKAEGLNAELMKVKTDNTDIYRIMYATLFGKILD